jgi:hypothetical protein
MPRTKQNIPANESNNQRFIRVATFRVNTILTNLKQMGSLGNTSQYASSKEQHEQIRKSITDALDRAIQGMQKGEAVSDFKFK